MAQDLQGRTEDNRGASRRVQRHRYKKNYRCSMAPGRFSRGARFMATGVVLYHLSPGHHLGGASGLSLGPPTTFNIVDQHRVRSGIAQRRSSAARPHKGSLERRPQPGQRRPLRLWEFNPEGPRVLRNFMGMTPTEMHKQFFGPQEASPEVTGDAGLSCDRPDAKVGDLVFGPPIRIINFAF